MKSFQKASEWPGEVARAAQTILHQHAIQGDLSELQQSLSRWVELSKRHQSRGAQPLDYALLYQLLEDVDTKWQQSEKPLSRDEVQTYSILRIFHLMLIAEPNHFLVQIWTLPSG